MLFSFRSMKNVENSEGPAPLQSGTWSTGVEYVSTVGTRRGNDVLVIYTYMRTFVCNVNAYTILYRLPISTVLITVRRARGKN